MTDVIKAEIKDFWDGVDVKKDKLVLDGDQVMMLFVFILTKVKISNIFAQLAFCKEFSTNYIKDTRMGYCLTTMEIALKLLVDEPNLIKIEDETATAPVSWVQRRNSIIGVT